MLHSIDSSELNFLTPLKVFSERCAGVLFSAHCFFVNAVVKIFFLHSVFLSSVCRGVCLSFLVCLLLVAEGCSVLCDSDAFYFVPQMMWHEEKILTLR